MTPKLTIGIATCGRPRILKRCIRSIEKFTNINYEIIILDNVKAFTNDEEAIPRLSSKYRYIEIADRKIGCCESNNILQNNCDTQFFMHIDDDVYIDSKGFIDKLFETYLQLEEKISNLAVVSASWYDTFYRNFRHGSMYYLFGIDRANRKTVKKIPIDYTFLKKLNIQSTQTDESLHTMILDLNRFKKLGIKWDNHFKWKGDRLDYFMQIKKKNLVNYQLLDLVAIHDPKPFKYGSLSYENFGGKEAIEYFRRKWNIQPIVGWDKPQIKPR